MNRKDASTWSKAELRVFSRLKSPYAVQQYLDKTPYSTDAFSRCPRRVIADRVAHCVDGALFAAAALRLMGLPPLIIDLEAVNDDEHLLTVFRVDGCWGAVGKSNCTGLRWREPIHRSLRELVMTYFDVYFNTSAQRTLRGYGLPVDLSRLDHLHWMTRDDHLDEVVDRIDRARHYRLLSEERVAALAPVDDRSYRAGFLGANTAGLHAGDKLRGGGAD